MSPVHLRFFSSARFSHLRFFSSALFFFSFPFSRCPCAHEMMMRGAITIRQWRVIPTAMEDYEWKIPVKPENRLLRHNQI